jgi:glucokinase
LLGPPNLGWRTVKVRQSLARKFKCRVVVANDVDAGTYAEALYGSGRGARCVLGVFPGTGVGAGCVYEGRILHGANRSCMELGHIQVAPDGALCGCGLRGCLETVASRLAISAEAAKAVFRGQAPALAKAAGADLTKIRSGALAAAIRGGDRVVEDIVRAAARWLGVGVATGVNLLAPDVVVLGGGLVGAMPQLYRKAVESAARERVLASLRGCFKVAVGQLGDDAIVMGAAAWARAESGGRP